MNDSLSPGGVLGAMREKYWGELNADEKIERMRHVVHLLQDEVERLEKRNYRLENGFRNHSHVNDKLMIPLRVNDGEGEYDGDSRYEVYF